MNYYEEIKNKLIKNEVSKKVREYVSNKNDLTTYYEVGKLLSMAGKHYGESIINKYAQKLTNDLGKKYSDRMLRNMRQFYVTFNDLKWKPMVSVLSWSHIIILLRIKNDDEMDYYINECISHNYSKRELERIIKNKEYERLPDGTKQKLINNEKLEITDSIKEPIILHKRKDYDRINELALKEIIMNDLPNFLKQLGDGYCFIDTEYKIKMGEVYNYIDILLFNILYNAYVVVELKTNEIRKQDIGQIQIYMNYVNENIKNINMENTIGIIVAKENNEYIIKYSTDKRIKVTTYEII